MILFERGLLNLAPSVEMKKKTVMEIALCYSAICMLSNLVHFHDNGDAPYILALIDDISHRYHCDCSALYFIYTYPIQ